MRVISFLLMLIFTVNHLLYSQWYTQSYGLGSSFKDIHFINDSTGFVVGDVFPTSVFKTTNYGSNWNQVIVNVPPNSNTLNSIDFINDSNGVAVGDFGRILKTSDSGNSWTYQSISQQYLTGVSYVNSSVIVTVGWQGTHSPRYNIYRSSDSGYTWNTIISVLGSVLLDVDFFGGNGMAIGGNLCLVSSDSGASWIARNFSGQFYGVQLVNDSTAYVVGTHGQIRKTTDFGLSWINLSSGTNRFLYGLYFTDINNGTAVGDHVILRTSDGGQSWDNQTSDNGVYGFLYSAYFINKDTGYVVGSAIGNHSLILMTTNGGVIPVELSSFTASSSKNTVYLNWSTASELNNYGFEIERKDNKTDLPDGKAGWRTIGFREGKGTTTEQQNYSFTDDLFGVNSHILYYRLKQIDYDGQFEYSNVLEVNVASINFALNQNYPNPFNPSTVIGYQLPAAGVVTLKVFDVLGREVATLVDEYKQAGYHEIEFNLSAVRQGPASGIYFYQLKAGDYTDTKKMMIIK